MVLEQSRSGPLTAKIRNKYIHSSYNPQKEALAFYRRWKADNPGPSFIILIEPGLGYLLSLITKEHPKEKTAVIFLHGETLNYCKKNKLLEGLSYILYRPKKIHQDLALILEDQPMESLGIMEWKASAKIFEDKKKSLDKDLLSFFKLMQANLLTERYFALRWFRNSIRNFLRYEYKNLIQISASPVILAASGPSLERHIQSIKENAEAYTIAALPSSLCILQTHGIQPDLLITTDGGYYAKEHLRYLPSKTLTAAPLSAAFRDGPNPLMGFRQNMFAENLILKEKELPALPERGTVAATALDFLQNLAVPEIYICGLDFCMEDIKGHASPHSFDPLILKEESRFFPGYSAYFDRACKMTDRIEKPCRFTKSMDSYQSWFSGQKMQENIFRLSPAYRKLPCKEVPNLPRKKKKKQALSCIKNPHYPDKHIREERVKTLVRKLEADYGSYKKSKKESVLLQSMRKVLPPGNWEDHLHREISIIRNICP